MSADPCELSQAFQSRLTDEVVHIPVRIDPKTDKSFVLWKNIQNGFENAKSIRNGVSLVPFMIDENFEQIIPLRIAYHSGVVLEVVEGNSQIHSTTEEPTSLARILLAAGGEPGHHHNTTTTTGLNTLTQTVAALAVADINTTSNQSLVMSAAGIPEGTLSSQLTSNQIQVSIQQLVKNQEEMIQRQHIQQQAIMGVVKNQEEMFQTIVGVVKNQEETIRLQKEALDRLAIIQNSVQALLTQT
ncbi:hypothetical protein BGZ65_009454, partial [Modicella reniformis]